MQQGVVPGSPQGPSLLTPRRGQSCAARWLITCALSLGGSHAVVGRAQEADATNTGPHSDMTPRGLRLSPPRWHVWQSGISHKGPWRR